MSTMQTIAAEAASWLTRSEREDGTEYTHLREGAPEWLSAMTLAAHQNGEILPNDWRYEMIHATLEDLSEMEGEPGCGELADRVAERLEAVTYHELAAWLAELPGTRLAYCDEAVEEGCVDLHSKYFEAWKLLAAGQCVELREIVDAVWSAVEDRACGVEA